MSEEIVSMDAYWNTIATPFFFIVLIFGTFVLFKVSQTQVIGAAPIASMINTFRKQMTYARAQPAAAAAPNTRAATNTSSTK